MHIDLYNGQGMVLSVHTVGEFVEQDYRDPQLWKVDAMGHKKCQQFFKYAV